MLETIATVLVLGVAAAFAIYAALLNEGSHAGGRGMRGVGEEWPTGDVGVPAEEGGETGGVPTEDRRLPVGGFLFGALFLRGPEALTFSELADAAEGSGMSVAQVLAWIERAEAGGLVERVTDDDAGEPALRLTEAGIYIACNDRRRGKRARKRRAFRAARALNR